MTEIYLDNPRSGTPFFSARVPRLLVRKFLEFLGAPYVESENQIVVENLDEEIFRRIITYIGVRQFVRVIADFQEARLMSFVKELTFVESLFWCSRFLQAHDYRAASRVARAFRILYSF
jgi:hypothetical protein